MMPDNVEPEAETAPPTAVEPATPLASPDAKRGKRIPVIVISVSAGSALVQHEENGHPRRVVLPVDLVADGAASRAELAAGVPVGYPWSKVIDLKIDPIAIEDAFYRAGFWTPEDVQAEPLRARNILGAAIGLSLTDMMRKARQPKEITGG